ncbi:PGAP3 [Cordylochernes scorpioides]|uniref:Post-GPI attachment to proteins factor 3 n=1 Tax=Cordylochernes scorpioides TaxID=51811 RepID=A0ABY6JVB7_9ARAC|nr:PGAP3 [Cordylochernes scorpioides]
MASSFDVHYFDERGGFYFSGDRAIPYLRCVYYCKVNNCTSNENEYVNQPLHLQILQWDCQDECSYQCMWQSLDKIHQSVHFIPQFHGKWPFIRFLGIQEPASALFSILNAVGNIVMWLKFRSAVPTSSPYYNLWKLHTIVRSCCVGL